VRGRLTADACVIRRNHEYGILIPGFATLELTHCKILENGREDLATLPYRQLSGIYATSNSLLSLDSCVIQNNFGAGLHVERNVELSMTNCEIVGNVQDGLLAWDEATIRLQHNHFLQNGGVGIRFHSEGCPQQGAVESMHLFSGDVYGWGNIIPNAQEDLGNALGAVCPEWTYSFLTRESP